MFQKNAQVAHVYGVRPNLRVMVADELEPSARLEWRVRIAWRDLTTRLAAGPATGECDK